MTISEIIGSIFGMLGVLSAMYMWLMRRNSTLDVLENRVIRLERDIELMQLKISETEENFYSKIDTIVAGINEIKISIAHLKQ